MPRRKSAQSVRAGRHFRFGFYRWTVPSPANLPRHNHRKRQRETAPNDLYLCGQRANVDVEVGCGVEGVQIGRGGRTWPMGKFSTTQLINTDYGFNIDSLVNNGVTIARNKIVHPLNFGFGVGGETTFQKL